jgi:dTDP-4-amino-4,6-dideoxygalactose transaminase
LPLIARIDRRRDRRQAIVERYERALRSRHDVDLMSWSGRSGHHLFPILVPPERRDEILQGLGERGIGCAVNYRAVHSLRYYRERFGFARDAFPVAASIGERTVSLPLWPAMTDGQVDRVIAALCETLDALPRGGAGE